MKLGSTNRIACALPDRLRNKKHCSARDQQGTQDPTLASELCDDIPKSALTLANDE